MKKPKPAKPPAQTPPADPTSSVTIFASEGDDRGLNAAKALIGPHITTAFAISKFAAGSIGEHKLDHLITALADNAKRVNANDLTQIEAILASQAAALNSMFGELARRSAVQMASGSYFEAAERYFRMAMKAQNQCRMTLETLSNIKNPPVVYARQANIANGPQQVNNVAAPPSRAAENQTAPSKLLESTGEIPMDPGAPGNAGGCDSSMEAVAEIDGATDGSR